MAALRWLLTAGFLLAASAAGAADGYYKISVDDMAEISGLPKVIADIGNKFDSVITIAASPPPTQTASLVGNRYGFIGYVDLSALSEANRAKVVDECNPTPCRARAMLTLLPKAKGQWPVYRLDSWR